MIAPTPPIRLIPRLVSEMPVPGKPTEPRTPRAPSDILAPRIPVLTEALDFDMFTDVPGTTFFRFWNLRLIGVSAVPKR